MTTQIDCDNMGKATALVEKRSDEKIPTAALVSIPMEENEGFITRTAPLGVVDA
jgi:hypothetical protein